MENVNDTRKTRLIFDYKIGRALLKKSNPVIDIKPLRDDKSKCILIFENTEKFKSDFDEIMENMKAKTETKKDEPIEMAD